jgi:rRNA maturation endonuclease Nob1
VGSVKVRCVVKAVVKGGARVLSVAVGAESAEIVIVPDTWAVQDVLKQLVLNL